MAWAVLCALPGMAQRTASLQGQVATDRGGVPLSAIVKLEASDGRVVEERPANANGEFQFFGLRMTSYVLTVTAPGFRTSRQEVDMRMAGGSAGVRIFLSPAEKPKLHGPKFPSLTDQSAPRKAQKEVEKGLHLLQRGQWHEAQLHFEKAVGMYPCYARAQALLGMALAAQNQQPPAEAALRKALACDRDFLPPYTLLGQILNGEKRFAESEKVLQEGLRRAPGNWQLYYELGIAHYGLGQYAVAEQDFVKAKSFNPKPPPDLYIKLAAVYLKEAALDKAHAEMQAYLLAEPNGPLADKIRQTMKEIEASGKLHPAQAKAASPSPSQQ